jgi:hypothetical protein
MNHRHFLSILSFCVLASGATLPAWAAECEADGKARFICGLKSPEDLAHVPGSEWILVSGMADAQSHRGQLYAVNARSKSFKSIYPLASSQPKHDRKTYAACPGPLPNGEFGAHGIDIRRGTNGIHTLYAVNHAGRESFEVFELNATGAEPVLTWIGCVVYPAGTSGNGIVALPDGGIATTNFKDPADANAFQKMTAGEITGNVLEWHADKGWTTIPDSAMSGANGIVVTPDGKSLYVAGWPGKNVTRFERGAASPKRETIATGILTDNLRWMADGSILAGGQDGDMPGVFQCRPPECRIGSAAVKIDPRTRKTTRIASYPGSAGFEGSTTSLEVGQEIWMGSFRGERILRLPVKP